jgi:DNA-binding MarR family transcriptional regulator
VWVAIILWVGAPLPAGPGHLGGASGCGPEFALSSSPASGDAPLSVTFSLTGPLTNGTSVSWSFGDGIYLNGTGPAYSLSVHSYDQPGSFNATVQVGPAVAGKVCSAHVQVFPGPLLVAFTASVDQGPVPLTVQFTGSASGGTGDYRSESWSFGDGGTGGGFVSRHTFESRGMYVVRFQVIDSSGTQGAFGGNISVGSAGSSHPTSPGSGPAGDDAGWIFLGVAIVAAVVALAFLWRARVAGALVSRDLSNFTGNGPPPGATRGEVGSTGSPAHPADPVNRPIRERSVPARTTARPPSGADRTILYSSQRVLVYLARQGLPPSAPVGSRALTQVGISEALNLEQSNLARVLQRLELAGLLSRELRHVPGISRRVRIHQLTPAGQRIASTLARREAESQLRVGGSEGSAPVPRDADR